MNKSFSPIQYSLYTEATSASAENLTLYSAWTISLSSLRWWCGLLTRFSARYMRILPQIGVILWQQKPSENLSLWPDVRNVLLSSRQTEKKKKKMKAMLKNGRCTKYLVICYGRLIVQSCVWDSSLKYPSPGCLHLLCHVLILLTSHQQAVCLEWQLLQDMYWGQNFSRSIFSFITHLWPPLTVKSQKTSERARQVPPLKQGKAIP